MGRRSTAGRTNARSFARHGWPPRRLSILFNSRRTIRRVIPRAWRRRRRTIAGSSGGKLARSPPSSLAPCHAYPPAGGQSQPERPGQALRVSRASVSASSSLLAITIYVRRSASTSRTTTRSEPVRAGRPAHPAARQPQSVGTDLLPGAPPADISAAITARRAETSRSSFCTLRGKIVASQLLLSSDRARRYTSSARGAIVARVGAISGSDGTAALRSS